MSVNKLLLSACAALVLSPILAHAVDSGSVEFGTGNRTQMIRVGLQSDWSDQWWAGNGSHLGGYWNYDLAQWRGNRYQNIPDQTQNITDIGITPVFRYQMDGRVGPFFEAAIGAHILSDLYDNNGRKLSTRFEFGDHLAVGYQAADWAGTLKIQHFSNGGIKHPNYGVNWVVLGVSKRF